VEEKKIKSTFIYKDVVTCVLQNDQRFAINSIFDYNTLKNM